MTQQSFLPLADRIPDFRLLWCPLALGIGLVALALSWTLRPCGADLDGSAALSAAIGSSGILVALSAPPLPSGADRV